MIICEDDLKKIVGKFIIEVNDDDQDPFTKQSKGFLLEKRISQVCAYDAKNLSGYLLTGFYYNHSKILSNEEFINKINTCTEGRHYRLLTVKELKKMNEWLIEDLLESY